MIQFHDVDEFLQELKFDADKVERHIVRITQRFRSASIFVEVSVVATAKINGEIVRLDRRVGQDIPPLDKQLLAPARALIEKLETELRALDLDVRAGIYQ